MNERTNDRTDRTERTNEQTATYTNAFALLMMVTAAGLPAQGATESPAKRTERAAASLPDKRLAERPLARDSPSDDDDGESMGGEEEESGEYMMVVKHLGKPFRSCRWAAANTGASVEETL